MDRARLFAPNFLGPGEFACNVWDLKDLVPGFLTDDGFICDGVGGFPGAREKRSAAFPEVPAFLGVDDGSFFVPSEFDVTRDEFPDDGFPFVEREADSSLEMRSPSERCDFIAVDMIRARD